MMNRIFSFCAVFALLAFSGCGDKKPARPLPASEPSPGAEGNTATAPAAVVKLTFTYGSEKDAWLKAATQAFHNAGIRTASGAGIQVSLLPMGSGDCVREALDGTRKVDLISPASEAFIRLGNAERRNKANTDLVEKTDALVLSPVVIAMWQPMAEALGWPNKPIGWKDILALAKNPKGWAGYDHPEWGEFKFGHTHPEYSNSGLISALAMNYAAVQKTHGLSSDDINAAPTQKFVEEIEAAVIHYGESTGFFAKKMADNGPSYLSAAVLYESSILETRQPDVARKLAFPIVAIYPAEGTFWSDHPVGIVSREWVTPEKREAAKKYIEFLLGNEAQRLAAGFGFRPSDPSIALPETFNRTNGVDAQEPKTTLEVPAAPEISAVLESWKNNKKRSEITLVIDTSGSMKEDDKLVHAKDGAVAFINQLHDKDIFSCLAFSATMRWLGDGEDVGPKREMMNNRVRGLIEGGGTALYDSILSAYEHIATRKSDVSRIRAIVVLTDGADTESHITLAQLVGRIRISNENTSVRVFTIGYGKDADQSVLSKIANATGGKSYVGTTTNITAILKEISTFF